MYTIVNIQKTGPNYKTCLNVYMDTFLKAIDIFFIVQYNM